MDSIDDIEIAACAAPSQIGYTHRVRGLVVIGLIAGLAAMVATTLAAALAQAVGVASRSPRMARRSRGMGSPW